MRRARLACITLGLCGPAAAQDQAALYGACFARSYDETHLAAHPEQRVAALAVFFQEYEDNLWAGASYMLRDGGRYFFSGDCFERIDGGFLCHVCANDSCDETGETFKVLWTGGETLDLVNDTTGVRAESLDGKRDQLAAGGEDGTFRLSPAAREACDW
jgi:hypothetical protein